MLYQRGPPYHYEEDMKLIHVDGGPPGEGIKLGGVEVAVNHPTRHVECDVHHLFQEGCYRRLSHSVVGLTVRGTPSGGKWTTVAR